MEKSQEDIIRRVKALLKIAESRSATNPDEAASFAAKAQELVQEYNLAQLDLVDAPVASVECRIYKVKNTLRWNKQLLGSIAHTNFCRLVYYPGQIDAYIFGESQNIDVSIALYEYLAHELEQLAIVDYAKHIVLSMKARRRPATPDNFKHNHRTGACDAISRRLYQQFLDFQGRLSRDVQKSEQERNADATRDETLRIAGLIDTRHESEEQRLDREKRARALVLVKSEETDAAVALKFPKTKNARHNHKKEASRAGYREGVQAGSTVAINKMI